jgi:signal peptidase II
MLWMIIAAIIIAIDQVSKFIIVSNIEYGKMVPVIDKFFYITYYINKGAAWGILQNGRVIFIIFTPVIAALLIYFIFKSENKLLKLSLAFILGGAIGNLIDRILSGGATDFLLFYIGTYPFPIFNAADMSVVFGTILLAIYLIFIYKEPEKKIDG